MSQDRPGRLWEEKHRFGLKNRLSVKILENRPKIDPTTVDALRCVVQGLSVSPTFVPVSERSNNIIVVFLTELVYFVYIS